MKDTLTLLRCRNHLLDLSSPVVMGIINVTPDSFFSASRVPPDPEKWLQTALQMVNEGVSILDIGGMSTRPGATEISLAEEIDRVIPAIKHLAAALPDTIISVDTYRSEVAEAAILAGASIVNDISGNPDEHMKEILATYKAGYVLMHMRGVPATMQSLTQYQDLIGDLLKYFVNKLRDLHRSGIMDIILDPGFGFAKDVKQNYSLINNLDVFRFLNRPLLIGVSRKSTLSKTIGRPVEDTLDATTALHMAALQNGVSILRVHDVRPAMDAISVFNKLQEAKSY